MTDSETLNALVPIIVFLFFGVATAIASRVVGLSPIVGYIGLGLALRASGLGSLLNKDTVDILAELGVVFLLFDIGLHFSLERVRKQASNIFGFGPFQVIFATVALACVALLFGMGGLPAFLVGGVLALSSTAVVARLISERHQQTCPVGLTATSILIFQDVAAIFLLIIAGSLKGGGPIWLVGAEALAKAACAFGITVLIARLLIGPLLRMVARSKNEEVFTATALLIALAAGWATGQVGLSLTLGAFLGGLTLAETPYKAIIESEIKPFRGLLLGFFFVSIGLSLDVVALAGSVPAIIGLTVVLLVVKILTNTAAGRVFKWSVPGSTQLGFLLAQGSEFAFVILSLPSVRDVIGASRASVIIAVVALSIAVTPNLAGAGRTLAGRMRERAKSRQDAEATPQGITAPVLIVGMGSVGRTVADALTAFHIDYYAVERDTTRLQLATADGYHASFGDGFDIRLWGAVELNERKVSVLTAPDFEVLSQTSVLASNQFPNLKRYAVVRSEADAARFRSLGMRVVVEQGVRAGLDVSAEVLTQLGIAPALIADWVQDQTRPATPALALEEVVA